MSQCARKLERIFMEKFGSVIKKYSNLEQHVTVFHKKKTRINPMCGWYIVLRFKIRTIKPCTIYMGKTVKDAISYLDILSDSLLECLILNA